MAHSSFCSGGLCCCKYAGKIDLKIPRPEIRNLSMEPKVKGVERRTETQIRKKG